MHNFFQYITMNTILNEIPASQMNIWRVYEIQEQTNHADQTIEVNKFTN